MGYQRSGSLNYTVQIYANTSQLLQWLFCILQHYGCISHCRDLTDLSKCFFTRMQQRLLEVSVNHHM